MSKALSVRIPDITDRQIQALAEQTGMTYTQLFIMAIDRLFSQEVKNESNQLEKDR